jgi:hypothetical protein
MMSVTGATFVAPSCRFSFGVNAPAVYRDTRRAGFADRGTGLELHDAAGIARLMVADIGPNYHSCTGFDREGHNGAVWRLCALRDRREDIGELSMGYDDVYGGRSVSQLVRAGDVSRFKGTFGLA